MIPQWGISGWISSGGCHCCDQCAGFSPFPGQGVWLHPCRPVLVWCNCDFFLYFPSFSFLSMIHHNWPIGTIINMVHVFTLAAPSFPPSFPSFLSLAIWLPWVQLKYCSHSFLNLVVLICHFQRNHLRLSQSSLKTTLHVTTLSAVSGMDVLPKIRGSN